MGTFKPKIDWTVEYPHGIIKYNDLFRHKLLDYDKLVCHLLPMYKSHNVERLADFGCGTGSLLFRFEECGFTCFGFDRHEESVQIATNIGRRRQSRVSFEVGDMLTACNYGEFDATIQAFVPISFVSQAKTLRSMSGAVRIGGLYSFMVVMLQDGCSVEDERMILNVAEEKDCIVARIEPWKKSGNFIRWDPVLLVQDGSHFATYIDHDELELYTENTWQQLLSVIDNVGFRIIDVLSPCGPASPPPWSTERLVTVELLERRSVGKTDVR
jgi:SAM-dependent methyltransferase